MNKMIGSALILFVLASLNSGKAEEIRPARIDGPHWPKIQPWAKKTIEAAMKKLGSIDPAERVSGRKSLASEGASVLPALIRGLYDENPLTRTECATLLGELKSQNAVKYLIESFYAAMPQDGQAATYQRTFVRALRISLTETTGQSFQDVEARSPLIQKDLRRIVAWYILNLDRLPPQVGEQPIEATDPDYLIKIAIARGLILEKKNWKRPPSSVELALGVRPIDESQPKEAERPEDVEFLRRFKVVDRETGGGFFREADRKWAEELLKSGAEMLNRRDP